MARAIATERATTVRGTAASKGRRPTRRFVPLRQRQQRNLLTTLLLAQGVPMIAHGDEFGRTQQGNNNVYCQDNELAWVDWTLDADQESLLDFTRHVMRLRAEHPVSRRRRFFAGSADHGGESDSGDIAWFEPDGEHMDEEAWANGYAKSLMVFLNGRAIRETDSRRRSDPGRPVLRAVQRPLRADRLRHPGGVLRPQVVRRDQHRGRRGRRRQAQRCRDLWRPGPRGDRHRPGLQHHRRGLPSTTRTKPGRARFTARSAEIPGPEEQGPGQVGEHRLPAGRGEARAGDDEAREPVDRAPVGEGRGGDGWIASGLDPARERSATSGSNPGPGRGQRSRPGA